MSLIFFVSVRDYLFLSNALITTTSGHAHLVPEGSPRSIMCGWWLSGQASLWIFINIHNKHDYRHNIGDGDNVVLVHVGIGYDEIVPTLL